MNDALTVMRPKLLSSMRFSKDWDRALFGVLTSRQVSSSGALQTQRTHITSFPFHCHNHARQVVAESELCSTYSISRENFFRLSRNLLLPPWWKCRAGRGVGESFSLKTRKVQPSFFTVTDFSSLMLKFNAHRLLSWLWFRQPDRWRKRNKNADGAVHCFIIFTSQNKGSTLK